jgi:hypothetical protein
MIPKFSEAFPLFLVKIAMSHQECSVTNTKLLGEKAGKNLVINNLSRHRHKTSNPPELLEFVKYGPFLMFCLKKIFETSDLFKKT